MKRLVVLDTETTGLDVKDGHRIIEIGCVEIIDRNITSNSFHKYINPKRSIDEGAQNVHGISNKMLEDKPEFNQIGSTPRASKAGPTIGTTIKVISIKSKIKPKRKITSMTMINAPVVPPGIRENQCSINSSPP